MQLWWKISDIHLINQSSSRIVLMGSWLPSGQYPCGPEGNQDDLFVQKDVRLV
jgi:hypothetical protein